MYPRFLWSAKCSHITAFQRWTDFNLIERLVNQMTFSWAIFICCAIQSLNRNWSGRPPQSITQRVNANKINRLGIKRKPADASLQAQIAGLKIWWKSRQILLKDWIRLWKWKRIPTAWFRFDNNWTKKRVAALSPSRWRPLRFLEQIYRNISLIEIEIDFT